MIFFFLIPSSRPYWGNSSCPSYRARALAVPPKLNNL